MSHFIYLGNHIGYDKDYGINTVLGMVHMICGNVRDKNLYFTSYNFPMGVNYEQQLRRKNVKYNPQK